jgi:hypothetical protein
MHYLLGLEVWQRTEKIFLNQGKYAIKMKRFDMYIHVHTHGNEVEAPSRYLVRIG